MKYQPGGPLIEFTLSHVNGKNQIFLAWLFLDLAMEKNIVEIMLSSEMYIIGSGYKTSKNIYHQRGSGHQKYNSTLWSPQIPMVEETTSIVPQKISHSFPGKGRLETSTICSSDDSIQNFSCPNNRSPQDFCFHLLPLTSSSPVPPRSPSLRSAMLTELAKLKEPMIKKRDALQKAVDNDEALVLIIPMDASQPSWVCGIGSVSWPGIQYDFPCYFW